MDETRTHGYSEKGTRCYGVHNWNQKGRVNAIGALLNNTLMSICLFEYTIDSDVFHFWVEHCLLKELPKHALIVLDNASFS